MLQSPNGVFSLRQILWTSKHQQENDCLIQIKGGVYSFEHFRKQCSKKHGVINSIRHCQCLSHNSLYSRWRPRKFSHIKTIMCPPWVSPSERFSNEAALGTTILRVLSLPKCWRFSATFLDLHLHTILFAPWIAHTVASFSLDAKLLTTNMTSGQLCLAIQTIWPIFDLSWFFHPLWVRGLV